MPTRFWIAAEIGSSAGIGGNSVDDTSYEAEVKWERTQRVKKCRPGECGECISSFVGRRRGRSYAEGAIKKELMPNKWMFA